MYYKTITRTHQKRVYIHMHSAKTSPITVTIVSLTVLDSSKSLSFVGNNKIVKPDLLWALNVFANKSSLLVWHVLIGADKLSISRVPLWSSILSGTNHDSHVDGPCTALNIGLTFVWQLTNYSAVNSSTWAVFCARRIVACRVDQISITAVAFFSTIGQ